MYVGIWWKVHGPRGEQSVGEKQNLRHCLRTSIFDRISESRSRGSILKRIYLIQRSKDSHRLVPCPIICIKETSSLEIQTLESVGYERVSAECQARYIHRVQRAYRGIELLRTKDNGSLPRRKRRVLAGRNRRFQLPPAASSEAGYTE